MKAIQKYVKAHPSLALTGVVVMLSVSVCVMLREWSWRQPNPPHASQWYYDMETGECLAFDSQGRSAPLTLPSGHQGVLAHMFICEGDAPDKKFIGYLEIEMPASVKTNAHDGPYSGSLARVALPPGKDKKNKSSKLKWFDSQSAEAMRIFNYPRQVCGTRKCLEYLPRMASSHNP